MPSLNIGITGATGFVGRHLVADALERGHRLTAFVRRQPAGALDPRVAAVAVGDLGPETDWNDHLAGLDAIIYLASRVHVMTETVSNPLAAYRKVNTEAAVHMVAAAARHGVKRFVYVSTVKANGEETPWSPAEGGRPFGPDSPPCPVDPYGISKLEAERKLSEFATATGLELVIVRPPLVYGPGAAGNFARLVKLIGKGVPLPLGSVQNRRSMISVQNLADLLLLTVTHPQAPGQIYLANDGQDLSTPQLVRMIARALGRSPRLVPVPTALLRSLGRLAGRTAEVERLVGSLQVDSSLARSRLDWIPPLSVADGLALAVREYNPTAAQ
ncbi:NAD-dependent epimerase/dehydratase family protein [Indioceanicola profundi]|uniref:NAD-dependent epimerase/dehydratase family protein n=1 Tax=Indioceanicola profundi TaxID=2220096 RepID=UPI000E6AB047|nr:NAD-dependent epimerase/dehydratase family protein [Indioceanicola profundi]